MSDSEPTTRPDGPDGPDVAASSAPSPPGDGSSHDKTGSGASTPDENRPRDVNAPVDSANTDTPSSPDEPDENPPLPSEAPPEAFNPADWSWGICPKSNYPWYYNRATETSQWECPPQLAEYFASYDRYAPGATQETPSNPEAPGTSSVKPKRVAGGYNPSIHGNYDPNADYAKEARKQEEEEEAAAAAATAANAAAMTASLYNDDYTATGTFNRFSGRFQNGNLNPENHSNEAKSHRQMNAFFDVDKAANSHDGRSLKAERRNQQLSKAELQKFNQKRKAKKEERRRAWLMD